MTASSLEPAATGAVGAAPVDGPKSEGHRLLRELHARRPARLLARRVEAPERTVRGWLAGTVPLWRYRERLESELGIGLTTWFEAPKTPPLTAGGDR